MGAIGAKLAPSHPFIGDINNNDDVFIAITDLGMFFLMLLAGIEMQPHKIMKYSMSTFLVAQCFFLGTALAITAATAAKISHAPPEKLQNANDVAEGAVRSRIMPAFGLIPKNKNTVYQRVRCDLWLARPMHSLWQPAVMTTVNLNFIEGHLTHGIFDTSAHHARDAGNFNVGRHVDSLDPVHAAHSPCQG